MNGTLLSVVAILAAWPSLLAQTPTSAPAAAVHHRATAARAHAKAAESTPALPAGVPPAAGKLQTAFALRYIDTKLGEGEPVEPGQYITVQYTGWLASNGVKFDSSLDHSGPFTFPQGMRRVIAGWDQGFAGMRVGGKRRLFIPYQLAYGEDGRPPVIPAKSDLIFDIELLGASSTPPPPAPPTPVPGSDQPTTSPSKPQARIS